MNCSSRIHVPRMLQWLTLLLKTFQRAAKMFDWGAAARLQICARSFYKRRSTVLVWSLEVLRKFSNDEFRNFFAWRHLCERRHHANVSLNDKIDDLCACAYSGQTPAHSMSYFYCPCNSVSRHHRIGHGNSCSSLRKFSVSQKKELRISRKAHQNPICTLVAKVMFEWWCQRAFSWRFLSECTRIMFKMSKPNGGI